MEASGFEKLIRQVRNVFRFERDSQRTLDRRRRRRDRRRGRSLVLHEPRNDVGEAGRILVLDLLVAHQPLAVHQEAEFGVVVRIDRL